jgi:hypothetical protein
MKFSAVLLATVFGSAAAFAPSASRSASITLRAATLEAPSEADEVIATPQEPAAAAAMNVENEKDWPIDPASNFVKDSDRILP